MKIIICNNEYKKKYLKANQILNDVKFYTLDDFLCHYYCSYDERSILYLINKYELKYEIAENYLNNLLYLEIKNYNNKKLDYLISLKKELIDKNLLIFDNNFKSYIKNKEIEIYYNLNKEQKYLLRNIDYKIIINKNNYLPSIYEFDNIKDEIRFVAYKISCLIDNNIDINKIKLTNVNKEYINLINEVFSFYNLKIDKYNTSPLYSTVIGKTFYDNLSSVEEAIKSIEMYRNKETYNKIISICNKYALFDDLTLVKHELENTNITTKEYKNAIQVVDYNNYHFEDEYVFMLSFNQGIIPITYKDEKFISDNDKLEYMDSTNELNIKEKQNTLDIIHSIKNLTITYKLKTDFDVYYPSSLIEELNVNPIKNYQDYNFSYSKIDNELKLACLLDDFIKFDLKPPQLSLLFNNFSIPYNTYTNKFTGINKTKLKDYIASLKEFNLSYSTIDLYNRCAFRFYLSKILEIKDSDNNFGKILGSLIHDILSKDNIDIRKESENYIRSLNINLSNANKFFINKFINDIIYIIDILKQQEKYTDLKQVSKEEKIKINIKDNINFIGFIDKIIYDVFNDETILAIIDYKSYIKSPSLKYLNYGIDIQLPTYMYLAKNKYKNVKFAGFYLQNTTNKDNLKLIGFTNKDKKVVEKLDKTYQNSLLLDGVKVNNDGTFSQNTLKKMLSLEEFENIISIVKNIINSNTNDILNAKFNINPKYDNENIGCNFCCFKDICFKKEADYEKIKGSDLCEMD